MKRKLHRFDVSFEVKLDNRKLGNETWFIWAEDGFRAEEIAKKEVAYRSGDYGLGGPGECKVEYLIISVLPSKENPAGWFKSP